MHFRFLIPACVLASQVAVAQHESQWRFGAAVSAPARLVDMNSLTAPDSSYGHVDLGIGVGAVAARAWRLQPRTVGLLSVTVMTAAVKSEVAGVGWSPGRALIAEAGASVQRDISERAALFGGAGISHWAGPKQTAPFSGTGAVLLHTAAGVSVRPGPGPWQLDLSANLTRLGADEDHGVVSGFVWRWTMGVTHGR